MWQGFCLRWKIRSDVALTIWCWKKDNMFSCSLYFKLMIRCGCFLLGHKKSSHAGRTGPKRLAAISCRPRLMERGHQRRKSFNREEHLGVQDEYNTIRCVQVVTWNDGFPDHFLWCWSWWDWFWDVFDVMLWFNVSNIGKQIPHRKVDTWEDSFHHSDIFNNNCPCLGICTELELLLSWRFKCNSHQIGLMVCHKAQTTLILVDLLTRINIKQLFSQRNWFFTSQALGLRKGWRDAAKALLQEVEDERSVLAFELWS